MRRHRDSDQSPEVVAELQAIDAVLAGEPVRDEHLETAALALALQAECPPPAAEFIDRLDAALREGFSGADKPGAVAPGERLGAVGRRARRPRLVPLAIGTAASVFIVATVLVTSGALEGDGRPAGGADGAKSGKAQSAAGETTSPRPSRERGAAGAGSTAAGGAPGKDAGLGQPHALTAPLRASPPLAAPLDVAPRARARKVERSASLTLAPGRDQVEEVADGVIRTTDRHGGFVLRSSVESGEDRSGASLELRIPSARLQAAIADLSELAHVRSRVQDANDITARFASPRRRLADATAERQGLLRQLALAQTPNQTASVRARLRLVNDRVDRARSSLRRLQNRVSYSAVSVGIDPERRSGSGTAGAWSAGDALHDAVSILGGALAIAVVIGALLVPAALLSLALWSVQRLYIRRRRDRALS